MTIGLVVIRKLFGHGLFVRVVLYLRTGHIISGSREYTKVSETIAAAFLVVLRYALDSRWLPISPRIIHHPFH